MPEPIISLRGVGKRFEITTRSETTVFKTAMRRLTGQDSRRDLWALRDVSFDIDRGEVLGIIGRNGAGKSTLLSILAGITEATEGAVQRADYVHSPFLGLGAGLQAELSVEDNIRLCSALLGLSRKECEDRLERIIEFGELEPYRYAKLMELSSGFQMRVAFSTAFQTESDFLIVDESLATGDITFQEKCLREFEKNLHQKKTVVLVSHSMEIVRQICGRCLYLDGGRVAVLGPADEVTAKFEQDCADKMADGQPDGR